MLPTATRPVALLDEPASRHAPSGAAEVLERGSEVSGRQAREADAGVLEQAALPRPMGELGDREERIDGQQRWRTGDEQVLPNEAKPAACDG